MKEEKVTNNNIMETSKKITIGSTVKVNCKADLKGKEIPEEAKQHDFIVIQENEDKSYIVAHDIYKYTVNSFDINVIKN